VGNTGRSDKIFNVLFVGVGGQGVIVAGQILGEVLLKAGFDVKRSEVHGMAQRGGGRGEPGQVWNQGFFSAYKERRRRLPGKL